MKLIHYSAIPLLQLVSVHQDGAGMKPAGLWVSVEGDRDWKEWCENEGFNPHCLKCQTEIKLKKDANVLHLATDKQIFNFTNRYGVEGGEYIEWSKVAQHFQGIIISPYSFECRWNDATFWYYGWDCASGCIWDIEVIDQMFPAKIA